VGLLCVQENTEDRPNMLHVVLMLGNEDELPQPKQPGFFTEWDLDEASYPSSQSKPEQTTFGKRMLDFNVRGKIDCFYFHFK